MTHQKPLRTSQLQSPIRVLRLYAQGCIGQEWILHLPVFPSRKKWYLYLGSTKTKIQDQGSRPLFIKGNKVLFIGKGNSLCSEHTNTSNQPTQVHMLWISNYHFFMRRIWDPRTGSKRNVKSGTDVFEVAVFHLNCIPMLVSLSPTTTLEAVKS